MYVVKKISTVFIFGSFWLMLGGCNTLPPSAGEAGITNTGFTKSAEALKAQGKSDLDNDRPALAVTAYEAALQQNENDDEARLGLAEGYLKSGKNDKAYDMYQELSLSVKNRTAVLQGLGIVELQRGHFEAAEVSLQQAVAEEPSLWRAWNGLGQVYDSQKNWDSSDAAYKKALEYAPKPYIIYNNMGVSRLKNKNYKEAADLFEKALRQKPDLEIIKTNYRLALAMQSRYDEATTGDDTQEVAKALNNAGYVAMQQGKNKEAERLFIKSAEASPSFYKTPYYNLEALRQLNKK
jgi:Flp pilus assembly protein TadD